MKAETTKESTRLAEKAMRRAARKVLSGAVRANEPVPLWDGTKVVWRVPKEAVEQMDALDARTSRQ
jgi:hypothetical protein